jgi:hypothetical protein
MHGPSVVGDFRKRAARETPLIPSAMPTVQNVKFGRLLAHMGQIIKTQEEEQIGSHHILGGCEFDLSLHKQPYSSRSYAQGSSMH